jgi:hypothetical protein
MQGYLSRFHCHPLGAAIPVKTPMGAKENLGAAPFTHFVKGAGFLPRSANTRARAVFAIVARPVNERATYNPAQARVPVLQKRM